MTDWIDAGRARALVDAAVRARRDPPEIEQVRADASRVLEGPGLAGVLVLCDLLRAGWEVCVRGGNLALAPPPEERLREAERRRIRSQLSSERDRQLASPAVRAFLARMESPRRIRGRFASVFSLMRDGRELAATLEARGGAAVRPYVQVALPGDRCEHTGLDLAEVWRYFRHTWLTPYRSTPGRGLMFLVRDAAAERHPVVGIAMLGSAPSQIADRDRWIGWDPEDVLRECRERPSAERAAWLVRTLEAEIDGIWKPDLLADRVLCPSDLRAARPDALERLWGEARLRRAEHERYGDRALLRDVPSEAAGPEAWESRAESPLFRAKRAELLAKLLRAREVVGAAIGSAPVDGLGGLVAHEDGRRAIRLVARRWKASLMGVAVADLQICGAVSPYRELLGGKLVAMLMTSRDAVQAYESRYEAAPSVIASSVAGRAVVKDGRLALLTTTALFGRGSSQYNRLRGGPGAGAPFIEAGHTAGFGSLHLSDATAEALAACVSRADGGRKLYSLFGEGVSPRLRKLREGLDLLGLPSEVILRHGARRTVYLIPLADNAQRFLCGLDPQVEAREAPSCDEVSEAWRQRWMSPRAAKAEVLDALRGHTLERPVRHGARVSRPETA